jgi:hypothetical protein
MVLTRMRVRVRAVRRAGLTVRWAGGMGAVIPLLALVFVLVTLIIEALSAIRFNGLHFFTGTEWNPGNTYGETVVTQGVPHPEGASYGAGAGPGQAAQVERGVGRRLGVGGGQFRHADGGCGTSKT